MRRRDARVPATGGRMGTRDEVPREIPGGSAPRTPHPASLALAGFLGGLTLGLLAWSGTLRFSRRGLFSRSPLRRFAALTYLGGNPSASSARLLRDYVRWETRPVLRRHGERLLRRAEHYLG